MQPKSKYKNKITFIKQKSQYNTIQNKQTKRIKRTKQKKNHIRKTK